jgi:hypothetical protein
MPTLSISGSVLRAETVTCSTITNLVITETVTTDEIDTITIPAGGSFTPSYDQSTPAKFVVIASDLPLTVDIGGGVLELKNLVLSGTSIIAGSLVLYNPSVDAVATVRLILGK